MQSGADGELLEVVEDPILQRLAGQGVDVPPLSSLCHSTCSNRVAAHAGEPLPGQAVIRGFQIWSHAPSTGESRPGEAPTLPGDRHRTLPGLALSEEFPSLTQDIVDGKAKVFG